MNGRLRCGIGEIAVLLVLLLAAGVVPLLATADLVSGQEGPIVSIESGEILVGGTEVTRLSALDVSAPPLCGFTVDVVYDPLVKDATHCNPDPEDNFAIAGCNEDYASVTVRVAGGIGTAGGVTGDIPLADITWTAVGSAGDSTVLDVQILDFIDCSIPPMQIPGVTDQDGVNLIVSPTSPPPVGGIVEVQVSGSASAVDSAADSSGGSSVGYHIALAAIAAAGAIAVTAGALYARRRWVR
jgi:hypothetical protein